jgi:hypothetical protein
MSPVIFYAFFASYPDYFFEVACIKIIITFVSVAVQTERMRIKAEGNNW